MSREPMSNIGAVCPEHAPKADARWAKKELSFFLGKHVKKAFPTGKTHVKVEHMWVRIDGFAQPDKLIGRLDNDPMVVQGLKANDQVEVQLAEIEMVYDMKIDKELTP